MEHLWETHGRRLSEAGLRRGSDNSVVLTEDTDSFIIGDRVWVGGTKPGQIAYIGETQFAPGDWAGIVLDEPIGKNDGSVAGCRYFQCEAKRGIFSRLSRLTRQPLSHDASYTSPTSPTESTRHSLNKSMSPSLNTSTTSLSSVSHKDLRIGERVIISSSQGSKIGVLRYLGTTEFASGEWCGVELDEPLGKNDGSVDNKRYFECRPNHGLFAPVHKVSRSPSNKKAGMCIVHRPSGAALNSSLRKLGSRESLASNSTTASVAATARSVTSTSRRTSMLITTPARRSLQDMLKEKQLEIETLRKERNLERERVTKAANQADQAEQSVLSLKKEYDKYREDMQKTVQDAQSIVEELTKEKHVLGMQLEEEKRKCEDLLFRFEEESIYKDDIQKEKSEQSVINTVNENTIKELEKKLEEERKRIVLLEKENEKLFEAEEELAQIRSQLQTIEENGKSTVLLENNKVLEEEKCKLQKELEEKDSAVQHYIEEINKLKIELSEKIRENDSQKKLESSWEKMTQDGKELLQEKCNLIDKIQNENLLNSENLNKEIQRLQETIESITNQYTKEKNDLITAHENLLKEQLSEKENQLQEILFLLEQKNIETTKLSGDFNSLQTSYEKVNQDNEKLTTNAKEFYEKFQLIEENNNTLNNKLQELQSKLEENNTKHNQEIHELEQKITSLTDQLENNLLQLTKLDQDLKVKETELEKLRNEKATEIEVIKNNLQDQIDDKCKYIQEISSDVVEKCQKLTNLEKEINLLKSIIANKNEEIQNLVDKTTELQDALTLSEQTKTNLESELGMYEKNVQDLNETSKRSEEKIKQLLEQKTKLEEEIKNVISTSSDSSDQLAKYNEDVRKKEKELEETQEKVFQLEKSLSLAESKSLALEQDLNKTSSLNNQIIDENEKIKASLEAEKSQLSSLSNQLIEYKNREEEHIQVIKESENAKSTLIQRTTELNELTNLLKTTQQELELMTEKLSSSEKQQANEKAVFEKYGHHLQEQVKLSESRIKSLESSKEQIETDKVAKEKTIEELKKEKEDINSKYNETLKELTLLKSNYSNVREESSEQVEILRQQLINVESIKEQLEKSHNQLNASLNETNNQLSETVERANVLNDKLLETERLAQERSSEILKQNEIIINLNNKAELTQNTLESLLKSSELKEQESSKTISTLNDHLKSLEVKFTQAQEELDKKNNLVKELKSTVDQLVKSQESVITSKATLESEIKDKHLQVEEQLERQKSELFEKEKLVVELQTKITSLHKSKVEQDLKNNEIKNMQKELEEMKKENMNLHTSKSSLDKLYKEAETKLIDLSNLMKVREKETEKNVQNLMEKVTLFTQECSQLKESRNRLEEENKKLVDKYAKRITESSNITKENMEVNANSLTIQPAGGDTKIITTGQELNYKQILEDNELFKGQIDFLNSVIVDMQKKNEKLLLKVEVLEMGVPVNEADDYNRSTMEKRLAPPRKFCDICDVFDLHETEDCPRQSQDFEPEPKTCRAEKKSRVERPYCEHCEVFGHDTQSCDETETF